MNVCYDKELTCDTDTMDMLISVVADTLLTFTLLQKMWACCHILL